MSFGSPLGAQARGVLNQLRSVRKKEGWTTTGVASPLDPYPVFSNVQQLEAVASDANAGLARGWGSKDYGHPQMRNLWRWDANGSFALVSQPTIPMSPDPAGGSTDGNRFAGGSDDLNVVVFNSSRRLTEDAPVGVDLESNAYLYRWFQGRLELVALVPSGGGETVVPFAVTGYGASSTGNAVYPGEYAVSADGSDVFFSDLPHPTDLAREVYLRRDDPDDGQPGVTLAVSASERTDCAGDPSCGGNGLPDLEPDPDAPTSAEFQLASADGARALFASPRKLTDDATSQLEGGMGALAGSDTCAFARCDLYLWDSSAPSGHRLSDLTKADPDGAGVVAAVGASEDANRVYFVAIGDLATGASEGEPNLYLWQKGQGIQLVATLKGTTGPRPNAAADFGVWSRVVGQGQGPDEGGFRDTRVTADGRYLVFRSQHALSGYDTAGQYQLYRFDAVDRVLMCVSCNPRAGESVGGAYLKRHRTSDSRPLWLSRNVTPGGRVVFDSAEALVAGDVNGKIDVYEWDDGAVQLLSGGRDEDDSGFLDASEDGRDVFLTTRARLVSSDADSLVDLYDTRIGGGFPDPPHPASCAGDDCQRPPSTVPTLTGPGSQSVRSLGNAKSSRKKTKSRRACKRRLMRKRVRGKVRCVHKPRKAAGRRARSGDQ